MPLNYFRQRIYNIINSFAKINKGKLPWKCLGGEGVAGAGDEEGRGTFYVNGPPLEKNSEF